jgi:hypothetical protein
MKAVSPFVRRVIRPSASSGTGYRWEEVPLVAVRVYS